MEQSFAEQAARPTGGDVVRPAAPVRVGSAHDPLEHEADRVAARILAAAAAPEVTPDGSGGVRRACACGGSCGGCGDDEDPALRRSGSGAPVAHASDAVRTALAAPGRPLDPGDREFFERRLGTDLGTVRLRTDDAAAGAVGAKAFTLGEDVVVGTAYRADRAVVAHELVHVLQARAGRGAGELRRKPDPAAELAELRRRSVEAAAAHLDSVRVALTADLVIAEKELAPIPAAELGTRSLALQRVLPKVGQAALATRLEGARRIYDAQRTLAGADDAVQGQLREAYAALLLELRRVMDRWNELAEGLPPDLTTAERRRHVDNLGAWVRANPFITSRVAGRTAFTPGEAAASARLEAGVPSALAAVRPRALTVNLVEKAATEQLIATLSAPRTTLTPGAAGAAPTAAPAAAPAADVTKAVTELRAWVTARDTSVRQLDTAVATIRLWLADPAKPSAAPGELTRFIGTADPGYGALVADRLAVMSRELSGNGSLVMVIAQPDDSDCKIEGVHAHASVYRVWLCAPMGPITNVETVLHETAHAAIPALGAVAEPKKVTAVDRAYQGERLLLRMSTEEALANAQTYTELAFALGGAAGQLRPPFVDTVGTKCATDADTAKMLDAMAYAQAWSRRAESVAQDWLAEFPDGHLVGRGARGHRGARRGRRREAGRVGRHGRHPLAAGHVAAAHVAMPGGREGAVRRRRARRDA